MILNKIRNFISRLPRLLGVAVFILIWEIAPRVGLADPVFIPPFSKVAAAWFEMLLDGTLLKHTSISLFRSVLGFGMGVAVALPLGLLLGWFKKFEYYLDALLQTLRQISVLSIFPVFILLFGIGEVSKVAIITWGVTWPILLNTITGVKNVEPLLIKSARSMGASQPVIFLRVVLPSAFPQILTGIRLSATLSILILVAAEMMGANKGLGFLVYDSETKYQIPDMYAAILTMALLGLLINYAIVIFEKRATRWKEELPAGI